VTPPRGDFVKASVSVRLPRERVFQLFTHEIDRWWLRGPQFRNAGTNRGIVCIEPAVDGRVFESWSDATGEHVFEIGRVQLWQPPERFEFTWRNSVFTPEEVTLVEVQFESSGDGTTVTVIHRGWSAIRADHPARHGAAVAAFQRSLGLWWGEQLRALRSLH
jgi:uncharacterized protein YndB with AHSA1/START domain